MLAALGAVVVVLLGAAPMAAASTNPTADPIVSQAIDGTPQFTDYPVPDLHLVDDRGRAIQLSAFKGKTVAITFLDPVCTTDCPLIAQEFLAADRALGPAAKNMAFVAVVANPVYHSVAAVQAFNRAEGLSAVANWSFLTGSLSQLQRAWSDFGIAVAIEPAGSMIAHSETTYVIDRSGHVRVVLDSDPGPATTTTRSSFTGVLETQLQHVSSLP